MPRKPVFLLLASLVLSLGIPALGQSVRITGKVVDLISGNPIAGARVEIVGRDGIPSTTSAADGSFILTEDPSAINPSNPPGKGVIRMRNGRLEVPAEADGSVNLIRLDGTRIPWKASLSGQGMQEVRILRNASSSHTLLAKVSAIPPAPPSLRVSMAAYISQELQITNWTFDAGDVKLNPEGFAWKSAKVLVWTKYDGKPADMVAATEAAGLNTIQIMDQYFTKGKPANKDLITLAHAKNIKVFIIFETFMLGGATVTSANSARDINGNMVKDGWLQFICPNEEAHKAKKIQQIEALVRDLKPDGISMDLFRYFVFWEGTNRPQSCFDDRCKKKFADETGITAANSAIVANHLKEWTEFKCRTITTFAARIQAAAKAIKPDVMMMVHTVPWKQDEFDGALKAIAAQDLAALSRLVDFILPMTYSNMLKKNVPWIHEVGADAKAQVGSNAAVLPCVQAKLATPANRATASAAPVNGYAIWPLEEL